jgi:DNA-binding transcriptional LysR family regulator
MQTIVGLVAGAIGVALVPASLRNLHRRGVVYKSVYGLSPTVELGLIWRRDNPSMVLNSFLQVAREGLRDDGAIDDGQEQPGSRDPRRS